MTTSIQTNFTEVVGGATAVILARCSLNATPSNPPEREHFVPHPSLIPRLREFLGNERATFKTREQAEALEVSLVGDRNLFLVSQTSGGKMLVYLLPAAQRDRGITCVLLPLSALHLDFERRCREANVEHSRWLPIVNEHPRTRIVYVSPEHAMTSKFIDYLMGLTHQGDLVQIAIDEVHLVHSHSNFRHCLPLLKRVVASGELVFIQSFAWVDLSTGHRRSNLGALGHMPGISAYRSPEDAGHHHLPHHPCADRPT